VRLKTSPPASAGMSPMQAPQAVTPRVKISAARSESATLGGGCFWCLEAVFQQLEGVQKVVSGYAGGHVEDPDYEAVCAGRTGHAEVVQVTYDPAAISYREVLEVFFTIHDPTTLDRQGADIGTQYRSIILTHGPEQEHIARGIIEELDQEQAFEVPIVTEVVPLNRFYPAEEYHQDYYKRNPDQGYCQAVIAPKLSKFRKKWQARLKK
jgi:peptide-methionine (S)-S-oxide reductase